MKTQLALLLLVLFAVPVLGQEDDPQRDPTIPSPEIQRRTTPPPEVEVQPQQPEVRQAPPRQPPARRVIAQPAPAQPASQTKIVLQSLAQTSDDRCTATLRAGDQEITVTFQRSQKQRTVQLPTTQFADIASTVQRLSRELAELKAIAEGNNEQKDEATPDSTEASTPENVMDEIEAERRQAEKKILQLEREFVRQLTEAQQIDLASSFSLDGNLYRVVEFTKDALLIEQIPLGKYILVR